MMHQSTNTTFPADKCLFRQWVKCYTIKQLTALDEATLGQLYKQAQAVYKSNSSPILRAEREILYTLQEILFGRIDTKLVASLEHIGETLVKKPDRRKKAISYNLPANGAIIIKQWKGQRLEVKIIDSGYEYNGRVYNSLSRLAKEIAGYAVSGPIFFGLRSAKARV